MPVFDEREQGFESKYGRDQERAFRVAARRNRLLGLWAAEQFGVSGDAARAYADEVVEADFEEPGDADVVRKVLADFDGRGLEMDEARLRRRMDRLAAEAARQIDAEA